MQENPATPPTINPTIDSIGNDPLLTFAEFAATKNVGVRELGENEGIIVGISEIWTIDGMVVGDVVGFHDGVSVGIRVSDSVAGETFGAKLKVGKYVGTNEVGILVGILLVL